MKTAFAIAAHPDDIELMMAGTLLLLGEAGYELHIMNIANGSCGSLTEDAETIKARRWEESQDAARTLGAIIHPPIANDIEVFYQDDQIRQIAAVIRKVSPDIVLAQSPEDYMEDHMNACRLTVTGAFVRGMPNYITSPPIEAIDKDVTVYHALPWGLQGPLGETIHAKHYVNIASTLKQKRAALACHKSQKEWLDETQGLDSYLDTMEDMARQVGAASKHYEIAEGWRKHLHLGFCAPDADPLADALNNFIHTPTE